MDGQEFIDLLEKTWPIGSSIGNLILLAVLIWTKVKGTKRESVISAVNGYAKLCADLQGGLAIVRGLLARAQEHLEVADNRISELQLENNELKIRIAVLEEEVERLKRRRNGPQTTETP